MWSRAHCIMSSVPTLLTGVADVASCMASRTAASTRVGCTCSSTPAAVRTLMAESLPDCAAVSGPPLLAASLCEVYTSEYATPSMLVPLSSASFMRLR